MNQTKSNKEQKYIDMMAKLLDQGKFESAIKEGENYIKEFPEQAFFYIGISLAHSESGDSDAGISFLKEAEKKFPDNYGLLFQLGKLYEDKFDFFNAIKYLDKSLDATPAERRRAKADCYNDIGAILFRLGKEDEAVKLWEEALVIDPANTSVKHNLKNKENKAAQKDATEFINDEFSDFTFYQMYKYFDEREKIKFSSKKEEKNFRDHMEDAFFKKIIPQMNEIEKMTEDEKIELYEDTEVNFDEPVQEFEIPKLGSEVAGHLQNVFPYLPDDGIIMILLVLPALEYAGISEEKINNFISQTETPDGRETHILKWAYEIGTRVYEFSEITNAKKKETSFAEIIKLLNQELNENDSLIVMDSIIDRINNESDNIFE